MLQEPPELVAMRFALGQQLAARREAAGIIQPLIARKTGYSRSSVAHAEAGRQLLTREFWQTADELLQADGALLAGYEQIRAAKEEHEARSREAALAKAYAEAQAHAQALRAATSSPSTQAVQGANGLVVPTGQEVLSGLVATVGTELADGLAVPLLYLAFLSTPGQVVPIEWRNQLYEQLRTFLRGWAHTMQRREHLRLLGWVATAVAASQISCLNSDEQERLAKVIAAPSRVDEQTIDHIETMLQHCKRQEDSLGPHAVLHTVIAQRELVSSLLEECPAELRPRLLSVYSSMSSSIGTYFFDLEDPASAMHYCDQARAAAQEARSTELGIYALCNMSYFSSWQGKVHAGMDFAVAAQSMAGKTDDVLLQVYAADRAGFAYAIDGQYKECVTEFDRAVTGLHHQPAGSLHHSTVYWIHEGFIASRQSDCLLRLGRPVEAAACAERGLRLFDNSFTHGLAYCTLRLGAARLLSGDVEEAARVIGDGALLAARIRSARLTGEARATRGRLQPWQDTSAVKTLDEQLTGMGFYA
ncbi:MAG TPA: helix-turn-helix transcriptional regulator [Pseudonocardiaceae bacterium]